MNLQKKSKIKFGRTQYTTYLATAGHFQNYLFIRNIFFLNEFKRTCQMTIT